MDEEKNDRAKLPPPPAPRGGGRLVGLLALLLATGSAAGVAWLWNAQQLDDDALKGLEQAVARVPAPVPDRSAEFQRQLESAQAAVAALDARVATLEESQRASIEASTARREAPDTRLAEAEYLQRMAAQSLLMGREVRGAIALLEASDAILRERDDPALHEARARLANDLAALRAVAVFDVEGDWLRLSALATAVPTLLLSDRHLPAAEPAIANETSPGDWASRAMSLLERFVVIRRDAPSARPLPALVDERMLRMGVRLALEQAKLALLSAEQKPYADALADASALVREHFDPSAAVNRAFVDELSRLAGEQIAPPLPDLSGSLRALREATAAESGPD